MVRSEIAGFSAESYETLQIKANEISALPHNFRALGVVQTELINTPDGDLRVNAVQNEEQRGGQTFSIIPFMQSAGQEQEAKAGLSLAA